MLTNGYKFVLLFGLMLSSPAFAQTPFLFTPTGGDDSAALLSALQTHRWVQINGSDIHINSAIQLLDANGNPLDGIIVEPAPGFSAVTVHTTINQNPISPTDPSRAPFSYEGQVYPGSCLGGVSKIGDVSAVIKDPATIAFGQAFSVGDYAFISDAATCPNTLLPADGSLELRKIVGISPVGAN